MTRAAWLPGLAGACRCCACFHAWCGHTLSCRGRARLVALATPVTLVALAHPQQSAHSAAYMGAATSLCMHMHTSTHIRYTRARAQAPPSQRDAESFYTRDQVLDMDAKVRVCTFCPVLDTGIGLHFCTFRAPNLHYHTLLPPNTRWPTCGCVAMGGFRVFRVVGVFFF